MPVKENVKSKYQSLSMAMSYAKSKGRIERYEELKQQRESLFFSDLNYSAKRVKRIKNNNLEVKNDVLRVKDEEQLINLIRDEVKNYLLPFKDEVVNLINDKFNNLSLSQLNKKEISPKPKKESKNKQKGLVLKSLYIDEELRKRIDKESVVNKIIPNALRAYNQKEITIDKEDKAYSWVSLGLCGVTSVLFPLDCCEIYDTLTEKKKNKELNQILHAYLEKN
jgi:hypothetical protein